MQQSFPCACLSYHMSYKIKQQSRGAQTSRLYCFVQIPPIAENFENLHPISDNMHPAARVLT